MVEDLLNAGAEVKTRNKEGKTAFDQAQENEKLQGSDALKHLEKLMKEEAEIV